MTVCNITTFGATVRFKSVHHKYSPAYSLKYRAETGGTAATGTTAANDDDDQKDPEWQELEFRKGVDEYTLNGLSRDSKYQIYGRYQLDNKIWSEPSEVECFNTYSEKTKGINLKITLFLFHCYSSYTLSR